MGFRAIDGRLLMLAATLTILLCGALPQIASADNIAPGHILVRVKAGINPGHLADDFFSVILDHVSSTDVYSFRVPSATTETAFAAAVGRDSRVVYAEVDHFVVSPEVGGEPFHFAFDLSSAPKTFANSATYVQVGVGGIDSSGPGSGATGKGVVVAVLDTGATFGHSDLKGHYLPGYNALYPALPPNEAADGFANYEVGHGTMVAGIIARLAPKAMIMPVRVLNGDGSGTILNVVNGIRYATTHGANIISMSFGVSVKSSVLNEALNAAELAGVLLVTSAGNDNSGNTTTTILSGGTLPVAALEADNTKAPYSNYGSYVRISAPGSNIRSTFSDGGYASWSGTSFAAPFVSAEAALIFSVKPTLTADGVASIIRSTARSVDSVNPIYKGRLGTGVIDIGAAVKAALKLLGL